MQWYSFVYNASGIEWNKFGKVGEDLELTFFQYSKAALFFRTVVSTQMLHWVVVKHINENF